MVIVKDGREGKWEVVFSLLQDEKMLDVGMWVHLIVLKKESENVSLSVLSAPLRPHALQPARLLCPRDSPGKNTGVDCHLLLQGIFPTQGSNHNLLHCR